MREELSWTSDYIRFTKHYYTNPKPASHRTCLRVPIMFDERASGSVIFFVVVKPTDDAKQVQQIAPFQGQVYVLNGGWPWVLVSMSNIKMPQVVELTSVGRDYR